jgi:hypothetical protein
LAVAALSAVLLLQPFLGIFNRGFATTIGGVPVLFAYLFFAWALIVALTAWVMETRERASDHADVGQAGGAGSVRNDSATARAADEATGV